MLRMTVRSHPYSMYISVSTRSLRRLDKHCERVKESKVMSS
jgi:hypothetical protein